jgi:hypothetical protein
MPPTRRDAGEPRREEWPSVEEQIEAAKAPRGSALEKLIREHQDLDLLHKEEAHDKLGFPPWLRVFWHKKHPEARYSAHDPSGGYPRVLKRIHAWMLAHPDLSGTQPYK